MKPDGEFDQTAQEVDDVALPVWWYEVGELAKNTVGAGAIWITLV
jgi:hypothetical protein